MENVVTIDLDGTLLNNKNEIIGGQKTIEQLKELLDLKCKIVINTGRLDHDILKVGQIYDLPRSIRLSQNGAVFQNENELYAQLLDVPDALSIWNFLKKSTMRIELNTVSNRYWLTDRPRDFVSELYQSQIFVEDYEEVILNQPVVLFLLIGDEFQIETTREYILENFKNVHPVKTSASSLEILPAGVSKGRTLRRTFPEARIFGIGDSENDFSVFEVSDYAYYISNEPHSNEQIVKNVSDALGKIIEVVEK